MYRTRTLLKKWWKSTLFCPWSLTTVTWRWDTSNSLSVFPPRYDPFYFPVGFCGLIWNNNNWKLFPKVALYNLMMGSIDQLVSIYINDLIWQNLAQMWRWKTIFSFLEMTKIAPFLLLWMKNCCEDRKIFNLRVVYSCKGWKTVMKYHGCLKFRSNPLLCGVQESPAQVGWSSLLVIQNVPHTSNGSAEVQKLVRRFGTVIRSLVLHTMVNMPSCSRATLCFSSYLC